MTNRKPRALPWAKFSYFVTVTFPGWAVVAVEIFQKRIPWRALLLLVACPLAWLMSGATLAECGQFIEAGFQLAGGYSAAMGLAPQTSAGWTVVISAGCVVLLLPIWLSARLHNDDRRQCAVTMLFFWGLLFIAWKSCFVRYHAGRIPVFLGTVLPLLICGCFAGNRQKSQPTCATGSASAELPGTVNSHSHWQCQSHTLVQAVGKLHARFTGPVLLMSVAVVLSAAAFETVRPLTSSGVRSAVFEPSQDQLLAIAWSVTNPDWRDRQHDAQLEIIRKSNPIPEIDGTVDVFPSRLIVAFAHQLPLKPRPVLQSYAAFTPALIERDARHLRGPNAPDHVLLSVGEIDGRLPTLEDSRTWLELLKSYDLTDSSHELLKLSRSDQRRVVLAPEPALQKTVSWGEHVQFPNDLNGPVWCRLRIKSALSGQLASILYRLSELRLQVRLRDNENSVRSFRLIPGAAECGFLISPLVESREDLIKLWQLTDSSWTSDVRGEQRVASIACVVSGDAWTRAMFDSTITVEFFEISSSPDRPRR